MPQGLISSSWGGTRIETWLSAQALRQLGGNDDKLDLLAVYASKPAAAAARWGEEWQKWWSSQPATAGSQPWTAAPAAMAGGARANSPGKTGASPELADYDGMMWYRAHVKLSAAQAKQAAKISLGVIDDVDLVWINGQPDGQRLRRRRSACTSVPAKLLKAGDNLVVVNVFDMWGSGGMHGGAAGACCLCRRLERGAAEPGGNTSCRPRGCTHATRAVGAVSPA